MLDSDFLDYLSKDNHFVKYQRLFFIAVSFILFSAGIHTYLNYGNPSVILYWFLSFLTLFIETVSISLLISNMLDILNNMRIQNESIVKERESIIRESLKNMISDFEEAMEIHSVDKSYEKVKQLKIMISESKAILATFDYELMNETSEFSNDLLRKIDLYNLFEFPHDYKKNIDTAEINIKKLKKKKKIKSKRK